MADPPPPPPPIDVTFHVRDADTDKPIPAAAVIFPDNGTYLTDPSGDIKVTLTTGALYNFSVSKAGWRCTYAESGDFDYSLFAWTLDSGELQRRQSLNLGWGLAFDSGLTEYTVKLRLDWRSVAVTAAPSGVVTVNAAPEFEAEVVLVAGTERFERCYGNTLRYPAQAVRAIRTKYSLEPRVTLLLFQHGYTDEMIAAIRRAVQKQNKKAQVCLIATAADLIQYVNAGSVALVVLDRHEWRSGGVPVKVLEIYSHGLPSVFSFDYGGAHEATCKLDATNYTQLKPASFTEDAVIQSYACSIGNSSARTDLDPAKPPALEAEAAPSHSLAKKLAEALKLRVFAFISRADYRKTWPADIGSPHIELADVTEPRPTLTPIAIQFPVPTDGSAVLVGLDDGTGHFFNGKTHALYKAIWNDDGASNAVGPSSWPNWMKKTDAEKGRFEFDPDPGTAPTLEGAKPAKPKAKKKKAK